MSGGFFRRGTKPFLPSNFYAASLALASSLLMPTGARGAELPEAPEKALVEALCVSCHSTSRILRSAGYEEDDWQRLIASMIDLAPAQNRSIAAYLGKHFPPKPERHPTLVPGPRELKIEEWITPTLGQRSRDPAEAPDGSIWWTGMWASLAGRLDPASGEMIEYHLPKSARPHSIVPDAAGKIWYTGNSNATIGRLDPETGLITEYATRARDPHTAIFHSNGKLYFTAQHANVLGRLNPEDGALKEIPTRAKPYGIKEGPNGKLWVAFNGTNAIGAMDPETLDIEYFAIPDDATRIRRLDIASDGSIWYVNSSLGRIGRLDPESGETREWPSPSGPTSHPYAIAVIDDVVWYNESGMRPDALVRFDPRDESFQSWAMPSGFGIIRHVWKTRDGDLLVHQSSSNRVGRVRVSAMD
ncbi:MAG: hypothetical protein Cons2KO_31110 [Congregibacter sp.]